MNRTEPPACPKCGDTRLSVKYTANIWLAVQDGTAQDAKVASVMFYRMFCGTEWCSGPDWDDETATNLVRQLADPVVATAIANCTYDEALPRPLTPP